MVYILLKFNTYIHIYNYQIYIYIYIYVRGATPPQIHCSLKFIAMMPCVQGLRLVGPWALGLGTWREVARSIGSTALA